MHMHILSQTYNLCMYLNSHDGDIPLFRCQVGCLLKQGQTNQRDGGDDDQWSDKVQKQANHPTEADDDFEN